LILIKIYFIGRIANITNGYWAEEKISFSE